MTDFLTTFLASILHEQGVANAAEVAARAAADLRRSQMVDEHRITLAAIHADPCRDYKLAMRHHRVCMATVYKAWKMKTP